MNKFDTYSGTLLGNILFSIIYFFLNLTTEYFERIVLLPTSERYKNTFYVFIKHYVVRPSSITYISLIPTRYLKNNLLITQIHYGYRVLLHELLKYVT